VALFGDWLLTAQRVAVHQPTKTAVVADLHLGYAEARQRSGEAIPTTSMTEQLAPLLKALQRHETSQLIVAGDLFETGFSSPAVEPFLHWLRQHAVELVALVPGNHDRGRRRADAAFPIQEDGVELNGWMIRHGDEKGTCDRRTVQGHLHPCIRWRNATAPCYLLHDNHLVLPAFCREAAGGNVLTEQWQSYQCVVIVGEDVLDFGQIGHLHMR